MFDDLTWDAILQAWPWFAAAATVFVVAAGLFVALKPKPQRQPEKAADAADNMEWTLTRRIDLADPELVGAFVLQVEESRISTSPTGVEHREIRWRRATLPEAKMVLKSYNVQQNLTMSATHTATGPAEIQQRVNELAKSVEADSTVVGDGRDLADVTLVPRDVTH
jgi:hypothetical protein